MSKRVELDPRTLRVMARRLWRHGRAQAAANAYCYAQGVFAASARCLDEAKAIERKRRKPVKR